MTITFTWTAPSNSGRYFANIIDNNQIGMCEHITEYNNGRITCTQCDKCEIFCIINKVFSFSQYIGVINEGQDLNQSPYQIHSAVSSRRGIYLQIKVPIISD